MGEAARQRGSFEPLQWDGGVDALPDEVGTSELGRMCHTFRMADALPDDVGTSELGRMCHTFRMAGR
eukprot:250975-Chlamydomonas_euryale.AAC.2